MATASSEGLPGAAKQEFGATHTKPNSSDTTPRNETRFKGAPERLIRFIRVQTDLRQPCANAGRVALRLQRAVRIGGTRSRDSRPLTIAGSATAVVPFCRAIRCSSSRALVQLLARNT